MSRDDAQCLGMLLSPVLPGTRYEIETLTQTPEGGCLAEVRLSPAETDQLIAQRQQGVAIAAKYGIAVNDVVWPAFIRWIYETRARNITG